MNDATRSGFGKGLAIAGKMNKNIVVLSADLSPSLKLAEFIKNFPERFFEIGVAEQNMATIASGMAAIGKIPFITSFSMFSPGRNWEQIRTTICYNNQPVKIIGSHAGISTGEDGATHQALEDIAITRVIPNMQVIEPCDSIESKKATIAISKTKFPTYLRLHRNKTPLLTKEESEFKIGKANVLKKGSDLTIIGCGPVLANALIAAKESKKSVRVINCHTIKPLDEKTILKAAKETNGIITIEDHQTNSGLGSAIAEFLSENYPVKIKRMGIDDSFGESGTAEQLFKKHKLDINSIKKQINKF
jgi:transketolase